MTIRPIFAWYDLWIGIYVDRPKRRLYLFPVPMLGVVLDFGPRFSGPVEALRCLQSTEKRKGAK